MPNPMKRLLEAAQPALDAAARTTGLRVDASVLRFVEQDARALASYLASPARRRAERRAAAAAHTPGECYDFAQAYFGVGPVQRRREIAGLLELARANGTRVACEIGAHDAGTGVMFSRALEPELLVVMDLYVKNRWRLRPAAPPGQAICLVDGDSSHRLTAARLRRKLKGRRLDLLLIDGDHRWAGLKQDFLTYRDLVRPGGLIAYHDICPVRDPDLGLWAGDVPEFWPVVRDLHESFEFVDSPGQQGLGIGVIRHDPTRSVASVVAAAPPPAAPPPAAAAAAA